MLSNQPTNFTVRSKGTCGAGLALLSENLLLASFDMLLDGIHKGSEGEEDPEVCGEDPLKQKRSRWIFHGDINRCYPMTDGEGEALLITYLPSEITGYKLRYVALRNDN